MKNIILIKSDNTEIHDKCCLCGNSINDGRFPAELFSKSVYHFICDVCCEKEVPTLVEGLKIYHESKVRKAHGIG